MDAQTTELFLPAQEFRRRLQKLKPFMAKDDHRKCLNGLYFDYRPGNLTLCATNGLMLCEMILHVDKCPPGQFSFVVPHQDILRIYAMLTGAKAHEVIGIEVSRTAAQHKPAHVTFVFGEVRYTATTITEPFPDYRRFFPVDTYVMREGICADFVLAALKALGDVPVDMSVDRSLSAAERATAPHLFASDKDRTTRCVVMPRRI